MNSYDFHFKDYIKSIRANTLKEAKEKLTGKERRCGRKKGYIYSVNKDIKWY